MSDLVIENKIGAAKGTQVEQEVLNNFQGETSEVGLYLAIARQAEREGYPEVATALRNIALEEAAHAARFAELNGLISPSTEDNLKKMLAGETGANAGKRKAALKAKDNDIDAAHDVFDESAKDEARHARALEGLLQRYFG